MPDPLENAPEGDILEQRADVEEPESPTSGPVPLEADEADVTEQRREVRLDEDEYR
ncbi:hypothetical protein [Actinocorallia longicatena]|uniref:Nucleotide exchange factor GrpE n=1 Tax=Actinocorallia longicatena TaxID=111803 RepID=A0ABP6Q0U6_9ACTN